MTETEAKSKPAKSKPAKVKRDNPTFESAAVYRKTVPEAEAAHLQSAYGFRLETRNADGTFTMRATSSAYAMYKAGQ